ncbi:tRNA lysidine(34) synthetase TilS [Paenibacillus sp. MBLB4367]|uniref:tRNA lysidine(34) synthetase TilS n=1 Tax=Paenibacillus sp. MBLB4367 TaxID=3384767 RepID=UPI00390841FD
MELVRKIEQEIVFQRLLEPEDSVVVAVSGGPDSVALLHILFLLSGEWRFRLVVAHVNHQFRGEESDREAEQVRELSQQLGLPCEIGVVDVPAYIRETGDNPQNAAREKRYEFLRQVAERYNASRIALAHHADDQAETVLMRILRGSGLSGLSGIHQRRIVKNVELIRPLLRIYKSEVLKHCELYGLAYSEDSSNAERKYMRNRVRLDLMPQLMQYNPQLPQALNRMADLAGTEDDYMEGEAKRAFDRLATAEAGGFHFLREAFAELHVALQRRLIKLILSYLAKDQGLSDFITMEWIRSAIMQAEPTTMTHQIGERIFFVREYEVIRFTVNEAPAEGFHYIVRPEGGEWVLPGTGWRVSAISDEYACEAAPLRDERRLGPEKDEIRFDLDELQFPLTVRNRNAGDRMELSGLNGTKKVKDIFIDDKVPPRLRDRLPLVVDVLGRVLWMPGRRSAHAKPSAGTSRIFRIRLDRGDRS